jgi:hypothetical protein
MAPAKIDIGDIECVPAVGIRWQAYTFFSASGKLQDLQFFCLGSELDWVAPFPELGDSARAAARRVGAAADTGAVDATNPYHCFRRVIIHIYRITDQPDDSDRGEGMSARSRILKDERLSDRFVERRCGCASACRSRCAAGGRDEVAESETMREGMSSAEKRMRSVRNATRYTI